MGSGRTWWALALAASLVACDNSDLTFVSQENGDAGADADAQGDAEGGTIPNAQAPGCEAGKYLTATGCAACSATCEAGTFESAACSDRADRVCKACSVGCDVGSFESAACSAKADRVCTSCSPTCAPGSYESAACGKSSDRVCSTCKAIANCTKVTCSTASDETCVTCAANHYPSGSTCVRAPTGQAYLKAPNTDPGDSFGDAVAIDGDTVVVGAPREASNATGVTNGTSASANNTAPDAGAAYVYRRSGSTWVAEAYLKGSNTVAGDRFGSAVAISGETIVVGSADQAGEGAVYVFARTGNTWSEQAVLKASNKNAGDAFGHSVAIAGDTIIVGAPAEASNQTTVTNGAGASADNTAAIAGAAYVYRRSGITWSQEAYLKANNAAPGHYFGMSVAIAGDSAVVGATGEAGGQGAAYVFARTGNTWSQQGYLKAPNAESGDSFGTSVGIAGDTVVVGAFGESSQQKSVTNGPTAAADNLNSGAGAAYVFTRTANVWSQQAYLKASNSDVADGFGVRVAIAGNAIVVTANGEDSAQTSVTGGGAAPFDNNAAGSGAAYLFTRSGTSWSQVAYVKAPNANAGDVLGAGVGLSGSTLVLGASAEASNQTTITNGPSASANNAAASAGAAYVFTF